ncbi:MAG: helix-turn-helix transcriptional regulator [Bacteroidales bacterium]|nr:helix-turn-helix transcriptional regulator [Bacteroidales bacterium]
MKTIDERQQVMLENKIQKYFISTAPYIDQGICPTKNLLATSLDKWSLFCILNLGYFKVLRFNQLKKNIDGISSRMLAVTLQRLENHDIVARKVFSSVPPKVEYSLTSFGFELANKIIDLSNWFMDNSKALQ